MEERIVSKRDKEMVDKIWPYLDLHGNLVKDAPREIVELRKKMFEESLSKGQ